MNPPKMTMSPSYVSVVEGLRELHRLNMVGNLESPEADAVRDATDAPWEALTETEKTRVAGLSEDMYSLTDLANAIVKERNPQANSRLQEIKEARQKGEWDNAFGLLRRWGAYVDLASLSVLRGAIWAEAGDPATAAFFFKHAWDSRPRDVEYFRQYLAVLNSFAPLEAQYAAKEILEDRENQSPQMITYASSFLMDHARGLSESDATQLFRDLIPILESTLEKFESEFDANLPGPSTASGMLGLCYEFLGEIRTAIDYYSRALIDDPRNDALLVARGILTYGQSSQAIDDLNLAIEVGSPLIWPFYLLAHHHLVIKEFEKCRHYCNGGLATKGSPSVSSELAEWLAISCCELGYPMGAVRSAFQESLRYDPSNERAKQNFGMFDTLARPIPSDRFVIRTKAAVQETGLSGLKNDSRRAA